MLHFHRSPLWMVLGDTVCMNLLETDTPWTVYYCVCGFCYGGGGKNYDSLHHDSLTMVG